VTPVIQEDGSGPRNSAAAATSAGGQKRADGEKGGGQIGLDHLAPVRRRLLGGGHGQAVPAGGGQPIEHPVTSEHRVLATLNADVGDASVPAQPTGQGRRARRAGDAITGAMDDQDLTAGRHVGHVGGCPGGVRPAVVATLAGAAA
jgi:hypothetical protein